MTAIDQREPAKLDYFTKIVAVHWPAREGRLLIEFTSTVSIAGLVQPACKVPAFTAPVIDKIETCTKATIPEHTVFVRTYFAWSPNAATPTLSNYNKLLHTNGAMQVLYGAQFSQELSFGGAFFTVDTFPSLLHPSATGFYATLASCQAYCDELNVFAVLDTQQKWFDENNAVQGPVGRVGFIPLFLDVPVVIPAQSTASLQARYLFKTPDEFLDFIGSVIGPDTSTAIGKTFHQKVNKISQLKGSPDHTAMATRIGDVDYHITTFPLDGAPKTWQVFIMATSHDGGGG